MELACDEVQQSVTACCAMHRPGNHLNLSVPLAREHHGEVQPLLHYNYHRRLSEHRPPPPYYQVPDEVFSVFPTAPRPSVHDDADKWLPTVPKQKKIAGTNWCGILLAFLSGGFFTLASAGVKALRGIDPMELLFIRGLLQVIVMMPFACRSGQSLVGPKGHRLMLQLQGLVGGINLALLFFSFRRLPLGDATTIIFSAPVFVMILSFLVLKEPCGFFRTLIVFLLLTGVVLISKPPFIFQTSHEHYDVIGYACAITGTLFSALNIVVMRKCKDVHFSVLVMHLSAWCVAVAAGVVAALGRHLGVAVVAPRGLHQWGLAVGVCVCGLLGQVLVAKALAKEGAGKVAVTRSLDIVLAFILQVFVFGEVPDWMSIMGAAFVLTCVIGMGLEEQIHYLFSMIP